MTIAKSNNIKQSAKQPSKPTREQLTQIAEQLACPSGAAGIEMAAAMHASNLPMTLSAIDALKIGADDTLLELGHGNGAHLDEIMKHGATICYVGLEVSALMTEQANLINQPRFNEQIQTKQICFVHYDGQRIPYAYATFNKVMSVNSIYFWQDKQALLAEIARTLKVGGTLAIAYVQKAFMQGLPFVDKRFELFDNDDIVELVQTHNQHCPKRLLHIKAFIDCQDTATSKSGELVDRPYTIASIQRVG